MLCAVLEGKWWASERRLCSADSASAGAAPLQVDSADFSDEPLFYALPEALSRRVWPETFASWLMWTMAALCTFAIAFNVACHIVGIAADE